mmetsp:Transcript_23073/g.58817  ORF Transcript_23073/g.58817 Transcript_23073/m.58817 type:complete len:582 (-) Transcript_23073:165-1910(-)
MGCQSSKDATDVTAVSVQVSRAGEDKGGDVESLRKKRQSYYSRIKEARKRWRKKKEAKKEAPIEIKRGKDDAPLTSGLALQQDTLHDLDLKYDMKNAITLGSGACGAVHAVKSKVTGVVYAMKSITLESAGLDSFDELKQELQIQKRLDHPNIAKVIESFEDQKRGVMYIVMEMCSGGDLISRLKKSQAAGNLGDERFVATLVEKILGALSYCHHHGIAHRDVKLENIMYESDAPDAEPKLIDFGFAAKTKAGMWYRLGTPSYMAPELNVRGTEVAYDVKVDVWALGVTAFLLLAGRRPFDHSNASEKRRRIREDPLLFPDAQWKSVSQEAKSFLRQLMTKSADERPSAAQALKHPWIQSRSHMNLVRAASKTMSSEGTEVAKALEQYSRADGLSKLAMQVIAFTTPAAQLEHLRQLFQAIDEDGSGTINLDEFKKGMVHLSAHLPPERVEEIFFEMDLSQNDEVDYTEFLAAALPASGLLASDGSSTPSLAGAFHVLDRDGDGYIDAADLRAAFDGAMSEETSRGLLENCDASGRVNFDAFKRSLLLMLSGDQSHSAKSFVDELAVRASKRVSSLPEFST